MPEAPAFLETFIFVTSFVVVAAIVGGLGLVLTRTTLSAGARVRTWLVVSCVTLLWVAAVMYLSRQGFFAAGGDVTVPMLPFAIVPPVVIALLLLSRWPTFRKVIDAAPLSWLVGVQFYRVLGGVFLALWAGGSLPGEFALPAGVGDVAVGVIAVPVAIIIAAGFSMARRAAYAWNIFGILDLVVAVGTGFLSSPGRLQQLALDNPSVLVTQYPLVMIPAFAVPVSLILHGLCLWKLRLLRMSDRASAGDTTASAMP